MKPTTDNSAPGEFSAPTEVRLVRLLPGPIERVWEFLTDPVKRARWFAGGPMEQRVGGKVALTFKHKDLAPDEPLPEPFQKDESCCDFTAIVTRCEPPRVLAYTFGKTGESEVTFELTPQGKDVLLVLTHRSRGADVADMADFGAGWHTHLAHLIAQLAGQPPPPFWSMFRALWNDYEKARIAAQRS